MSGPGAGVRLGERGNCQSTIGFTSLSYALVATCPGATVPTIMPAARENVLETEG